MTARVRCSTCGHVEVDTADLTLIRRPDGRMSFQFRCPQCGENRSRHASELTVSILTEAGVPTLQPHPESAESGPALTCDDLLDLVLQLASPNAEALAFGELGAA